MTCGLCAILSVVAFGAASAPQATPSAADLARSIQARYDRIRDFSADFVQSYVAGVLRQRLVERGVLQVKRPGRMRWVYSSPEEKVFVADGSQIYSYIPADHQVIVSPMPSDDRATTAALFLAGRGDLVRDFTARFAEDVKAPPGSVALRLDPRLPERDYDWLVLVVDLDTLRIRSLIAADQQGGTSTFEFANVKENTGLTDTLFVFRIPRGVDVIRNSPSIR